MHMAQTASVVRDQDWVAARDAVKPDFKPGDLVVFEPFWTDPQGRRFFGDAMAPLKNEARPDASRYARAFEVSVRGHHDDTLSRWKKLSEKKVGPFTITLFENPSPAKVLVDLVDLVGPERLSVSVVTPTGEQACTFSRGAGSPGGLGVPQGPAVPGDRFNCTGGHVGVAVLHAIDHHPHLCIFATATGGANTLRMKFKNVTFGETLHGHDGVQWVTERVPTQERILLAFSAFDRPIGTHAHKVGSGWTNFEFLTGDIAQKQGDLVVDVASTGPGGRQFCFEADTR